MHLACFLLISTQEEISHHYESLRCFTFCVRRFLNLKVLQQIICIILPISFSLTHSLTLSPSILLSVIFSRSLPLYFSFFKILLSLLSCHSIFSPHPFPPHFYFSKLSIHLSLSVSPAIIPNILSISMFLL